MGIYIHLYIYDHFPCSKGTHDMLHTFKYCIFYCRVLEKGRWTSVFAIGELKDREFQHGIEFRRIIYLLLTVHKNAQRLLYK